MDLKRATKDDLITEINRYATVVEQIQAELKAETLRADINLMLRAKIDTRVENVEAEIQKLEDSLKFKDEEYQEMRELSSKFEQAFAVTEAELVRAQPVLDAAGDVFERHAQGYAHIPSCCHGNPSECALCLAVSQWREE